MKNIALTIVIVVSILAAEIKEIKKNIPLKDARTIEMLGFNGSSIDVKTWDKNEISVNIKVDYSLSDKEKETENFQKIEIVQEQVGEKVLLRFKEPSNKNEKFSFKDFFTSFFSSTYSHLTVNGEIYVPSTYNLTSDMRYGTYSIDGVKGTLRLTGVANTLSVKNCSAIQSIENNYGTTTIGHSGGNLDLEATSSKIVVDDFKGPMDAKADYSTIKLNGISSDVTVGCSSGNLTIDDVGGNMSLNISYSKINTSNIKGSVTIESQSGTIRTKNTGGITINAPYSNITIETVIGSGSPVYIQNTSGQVELSNVTRDVKIDDSYSKLVVTNIQGNVTINGTGTTLRGKKITGNFVMKNEYGDIRLDELSATTIEITNKNNKVDIDFLTKPTKINIQDEYGPVYISFPEYAGDVRLKASYGAIKTNLPIEVEEIGGGAIAIGKVGSGAGMINIKTTSGNIEVQQNK